MRAIYAIGDIHGHLALLEQAHALIERDRADYGTPDAPVVHLGDLVDRGPESRGVIDFLMRGIAAGQPWLVLKGNHDRMFAGFLADPMARDPGLRSEYSWLHPRIGGAATLQSYGVANPADRPLAPVHAEALAAVPPAHRAFLEGLPSHHLTGAQLFVHAGIHPEKPLSAQTETELCWIREPFLSHRADYPWLVVHGHTALDAATHYGNRLNLDSGAAYGGPLSAAVITDRSAWALTARGRKALVPTQS
jgi:serine/threonine protein phosphatase 1